MRRLSKSGRSDSERERGDKRKVPPLPPPLPTQQNNSDTNSTGITDEEREKILQLVENEEVEV